MSIIESLSVVRIVVTVTENDKVVAEHDVGYFVKQPYKVKLDTPDGTDWLASRIAGASDE